MARKRSYKIGAIVEVVGNINPNKVCHGHESGEIGLVIDIERASGGPYYQVKVGNLDQWVLAEDIQPLELSELKHCLFSKKREY